MSVSHPSFRFEIVSRFFAEKDLCRIPFFKVALEQEINSSQRKEMESVFCDPLVAQIFANGYSLPLNAGKIAEIEFLPGVTDNTAASAGEALQLIGIKARVSSGELVLFSREEDFVVEHFANPLLQRINLYSPQEFAKLNRFSEIKLPVNKIDHLASNSEVNLDLSDEQLIDLSRRNCLALGLQELQAISNYFTKENIKEMRARKSLPTFPTQLELEVLAQTWSEHCKHKIFAADIDYSEENTDHPYQKIAPQKIKGLYPSLIKRATREIEEERNLSWLRSVFHDNAGIVRFDPKIDLAIKVETHNGPSALDPYGGALTGILGVNRDILGCGLAARPIANSNVFCVGSGDLPRQGKEREMPANILPPQHLLKGVHKGVKDGGNKSGVPTVNGAMVFDDSFCGRPLVFCGTVGVMPQTLSDGRESSGKQVNVGDLIVMVGGKVGADGIHGATFSSQELNEDSPTSAVQIGDPLTQKRVVDFILEARDLGLYNSITDNGAGGLSSSVGEMAVGTNGARLDLQKCPLKYPGLAPWEIMVSESQERMTLAVPREKEQDFLRLAARRGVGAWSLGEFNDSGFLEVFFGEKLQGLLPLDFLHQGVPTMHLTARWQPKRGDNPVLKNTSLGLEETLLTLFKRENIASKKHWIEQYDHEVQAATHIKPLVGEKQCVPGDSGVLWLEPHGGAEDGGIALGCGLIPRLSVSDPYLMAQYSVDEAVRNVIACGGDPDHLCLLDNFCWPDPVDDAHKLGQLVRASFGLFDICKVYGTPLVSGKDSMKNDFRGFDKEGRRLSISVLPTLLVTSMAKVWMSATITSEFKRAGDVVYRVGGLKEGSLLGSELAEVHSLAEGALHPLADLDLKLNLSLYRRLHWAIKDQMLESCHDISDGGAFVALCEGLFNGGLGLELAVEEVGDPMSFLFHEGPGRFVVSVSPDKADAFERAFEGLPLQKLGVVDASEQVVLKIANKGIDFQLAVPQIYRAATSRW